MIACDVSGSQDDAYEDYTILSDVTPCSLINRLCDLMLNFNSNLTLTAF
jgi:hypothetical protein